MEPDFPGPPREEWPDYVIAYDEAYGIEVVNYVNYISMPREFNVGERNETYVTRLVFRVYPPSRGDELGQMEADIFVTSYRNVPIQTPQPTLRRTLEVDGPRGISIRVVEPGSVCQVGESFCLHTISGETSVGLEDLIAFANLGLVLELGSNTTNTELEISAGVLAEMFRVADYFYRKQEEITPPSIEGDDPALEAPETPETDA